MTHLLTETMEVLQAHGKEPGDVLWVGSHDLWMTWDEFRPVAAETVYDNGFGGQEIARDLLIVGVDWWLMRGEYDGSEWWEFLTYPQRPERQFAVHTVNDRGMWDDRSLLGMNGLANEEDDNDL